MYKVYSNAFPGRLLHIVFQRSDVEGHDRTEVIDPENHLQLATLSMEKDKTFRPHQHVYKPGPGQIIAQESWVVISGSVRFYAYDLDGAYLGDFPLLPGDVSITLGGGHTYKSLEDNTLVYEYKTGPYTGQVNDKVFLEDAHYVPGQ